MSFRKSSTLRSSRGTQGFQLSRRYSKRRPPQISWHGSNKNERRNLLNSIVRIRCLSSCRGCNSPNHAFKFQAKAPITIEAQLDTRSWAGTCKARTLFLSCSIKFSWLQRSRVKWTTFSAVLCVSLVM